jgi:enterochelin esterase-like enzyme
MDAVIRSGKGREFIVVTPGSNTRYSGSHYVNSIVSGRWADAITRELVAYVDRTYRTIPRPESRGLAGHSMGGRATLFLAATVPGVYGAIYALSPGAMAFDAYPPVSDSVWQRILANPTAPSPPGDIRRALGLAVAFSPNPARPPLFVDLPVALRGGQVQHIDSVWAKWIAHDPVALIPGHIDALRALRAIHFSCGTRDTLILPGVHVLAEQLKRAGIGFTFEEYAGDHTSGIREQIETKLIPMFSANLVFQ